MKKKFKPVKIWTMDGKIGVFEFQSTIGRPLELYLYFEGKDDQGKNIGGYIDDKDVSRLREMCDYIIKKKQK